MTSIEAARAGDAGRGFAVVAQEVKALAAQTAKATDEIARQILAIQSATKESVNAIQDIGTTITSAKEITSAIAAAVEEQGAATAEIARNVREAARGTRDVSSNIDGVSQAAGETGQTAMRLLTAANDLSQQSDTLRSQVEHFFAEIKAAQTARVRRYAIENLRKDFAEFEAHPEAWSASTARPAWRTRRVHACRHRSKPAAARHAGRTAATC